MKTESRLQLVFVAHNDDNLRESDDDDGVLSNTQYIMASIDRNLIKNSRFQNSRW